MSDQDTDFEQFGPEVAAEFLLLRTHLIELRQLSNTSLLRVRSLLGHHLHELSKNDRRWLRRKEVKLDRRITELDSLSDEAARAADIVLATLRAGRTS